MKNKTLHSCRPAAWALAVGACLLLLGTPVRAQWLVQDEKLHRLIKEEVIQKQLQPINDKLKINGNGVGAYDTKELDFSGKDEPSLEAGKFYTFKLTTNDLLARKKENAYANDADEFFEGTVASCNKNDKQVYPYCLRMRNILGSNLKEIKHISKSLEARNKALEVIMKKEFKTIGELQKKQYEIDVLQAIIANDQMRLQTALASYQAMRELYKEQYNEILQARNGGETGQKLLGTAAGAAAFVASKAKVDQKWGSRIFKERRTVDEVIRQKR